MKKHLFSPAFIVFCLIFLSSHDGPVNGVQAATAATDARITVLSPLGKPPDIQVLAMAPRLKSLDGKTIYIVDDGYVGGDVLLKEIVGWFDRNMPKVHAVYRRKAGGFTAEDPALWAEIKEKGDAMIMGMGH